MRFGCYGVVLKNHTILLTQKKSGPYKGLWGLPGGAIEFGETPEKTLKRELLEETGYLTEKLEFITVLTATGTYVNQDGPYQFHQVGLVYKVLDWAEVMGTIAEEKMRWLDLKDIVDDELTPFAKQIVSSGKS